ncbi:MAG: ATP12 family protein [Pseudomonadota bacterium]
MRDILNDAEKAAERGDVGPGKSNREKDKPSFPKRFYKEVSVLDGDGGYLITLDERSVKTPGKNELSLPSEDAAGLVAEEWRLIEEEINPLLMLVTRLCNTAIDGVAQETQAVMEDIVRYASSDLLCYRADTPEGLVEKQREHWDPVLDWMRNANGADFVTADGIMHVAQSKEAITLFGAQLKKHNDPFKLACIHTFTSIGGSAILALALAEEHLNVEECWNAAHVDEDWNISLWGLDYEAEERRKQRWKDFHAADRLLKAIA